MKELLKNKFVLLGSALALFVIASIVQPFADNTSVTIRDFERVLHKKEQRLEKEMLLLAQRAEEKNYPSLFAEKPGYYNSLLKEDGLALLIYENDTLKFWSDNSIAVENWIKEVCLDTRMVKLRNGWFEVMRPHTNAATTKTIVGLILIKNEYPYQNNYLTNEFQKDFSIPAETQLITDNPDAKNGVKNGEGTHLFSLKFDSEASAVSVFSYTSIVLNLLAILFLILFLKTACFSLEKKIGKNFSILLFAFLVVFLRFLSIRFSFPASFYSLDLFSPKIYADASSMWLSSLGDLFINILLLFYLTYIIFNKYEFDNLFTRLKNLNKLIIAFLIFILFFWLSWIITNLFTGLIKNSSIPFSINNLFSLNQYSYIGIIIIGLLLFVYFLIADKIVSILKLLDLDYQQRVLVFLASAGLHTLISHLLGTLDLVIILWPFALILSIVVIRQQPQYSFSGIIFLVFIFSLYAVHVFIKHTNIKEKENRKVYAEKLAAEQDPVAEFLFDETEKKIQQDSILTSFVTGINKQSTEFENRLKQQYFSGFWEKYDVRIVVFDSSCLSIVQSPNVAFDNNLYFDELITNKGVRTTSEHFYFLKNTSGKISYIAKLPLYKNFKTQSKFCTLYIELDAKFISDEIGFPELLLDRNIGLSQELTNYSYAKYKNGQLINQHGKFAYNFSDKDFGFLGNEPVFADKEGYNHLLFRPDPETLIILSKPNETLINKTTIFSYLFAFFSLLLLSILLLQQISTGKLLSNFNLKYRIQILLVFIVLISLALFGGGTIYYIKQQFEIKNKANINEKIHSVLIEMESKLEAESKLSTSLTDYVSFMLKKYSSIFFTDINLYDIHGNLYASSRSKVFDEGLTSKKMDPEAFLQMAILGKTEFIHDERIGKLEYLSAYIPFKNKEGKLLAYLNLPYFAKQSELEKEISGFLVALINIYVLLFALSIITAIFISNYVTKPLKLIQDKLSNIKLGKANELIEWNDNDEIGNLVKEYNRMILELSKSAELLARSERESAWREMAKQVAHEIKNPLTPMKLSIQHLQRTWKDRDPDMENKIQRLTQTLIEQIETLSSIATAFSNFAKMPKPRLEQINVKDILSSSIALFQDLEHIHIYFKNELGNHAWVYADKEQLLRVFNNLLKNAVQSIPEQQEGKIEVVLEKEHQHILISITDNGTGIHNEIVDHIFTPNFTTKTGGMGLGLAMVKNILESLGGKIWFDTRTGKGTTFYISIPTGSPD